MNARRSALTSSLCVAHRPETFLDELGLELAGIGERHDLVVVTLDNERWYVELLQVLSLIRLGEQGHPEFAAKIPPAIKQAAAMIASGELHPVVTDRAHARPQGGQARSAVS